MSLAVAELHPRCELVSSLDRLYGDGVYGEHLSLASTRLDTNHNIVSVSPDSKIFGGFFDLSVPKIRLYCSWNQFERRHKRDRWILHLIL